MFVEQIVQQVEMDQMEQSYLTTIFPFEDFVYAKCAANLKTVTLGLRKIYNVQPIELEFNHQTDCETFLKTLEGLERSAIVIIMAQDLQVFPECAIK
jgi:hypothetical protein